MRRTATPVVLLFLIATTAHAQDDVRALVEKAVASHGGKDRIAAIKAFQTKTKGTLAVGTGEASFTGETSVQLPGQYKIILDFDLGGKKQTLVQVLNGDKVSRTINGEAQAVGDKVLAELKELQYAERVNTLLPLLEDRSLELNLVGEGKVNGVTALGVRVASKGHRDVVLYFEKTTGLLVKAERRVLDPATSKEVTQEEFYGDYKDIDGLKKPMKVLVRKDGKNSMQAEVVEIRYLDKLDEKVFTQP